METEWQRWLSHTKAWLEASKTSPPESIKKIFLEAVEKINGMKPEDREEIAAKCWGTLEKMTVTPIGVTIMVSELENYRTLFNRGYHDVEEFYPNKKEKEVK